MIDRTERAMGAKNAILFLSDNQNKQKTKSVLVIENTTKIPKVHKKVDQVQKSSSCGFIINWLIVFSLDLDMKLKVNPLRT